MNTFQDLDSQLKIRLSLQLGLSGRTTQGMYIHTHATMNTHAYTHPHTHPHTHTLQETAHYDLRLGEFHTSRGYNVLGSTLALLQAEINTPAGPEKNVCACACMRVYVCARVCVCLCVCVRSTHSCVSSMTHIHARVSV